MKGTLLIEAFKFINKFNKYSFLSFTIQNLTFFNFTNTLTHNTKIVIISSDVG